MSEQDAVVAVRNSQADELAARNYNNGDRMKYRGRNGALRGGFWGLLFGFAFFSIPGLGPVLVAGPLVTSIIGALEGAAVVGGLSAIGARLYSIGAPRGRELVGAVTR